MRWQADRGVHRLVQLKRTQAALAKAGAAEQARQAHDKRAEANALRQQGIAVVEGALLLPEQGLTRGALFDRLRTLAVARAHAMELEHAATELEQQASYCQGVQRELARQALAHQRKHDKLEHWRMRASQARSVHMQLHQQQHVQEMTCRPRRPR